MMNKMSFRMHIEEENNSYRINLTGPIVKIFFIIQKLLIILMIHYQL